MSMFRSRPRWPVLAALSLGAVLVPPQFSHVAPTGGRLVAARDTAFTVPDSVRALLTRVTSLAADTDGGLYLADPSLGAILNLTPTGDFRRVLGQRGSGPGEFSSVLLLGFHGDSLWAVDPAMVRLTLLPLRGSGVLTVPLGMSAASLKGSSRPQTRQGLPSAVLPDGSLLVEEGVRETVKGEPGQWTHRFLLRANRNLEVIDTLARHSRAHSSMVFTWSDGEVHYPQPFGDDPLYAVSSDGGVVVVVRREVPVRGAAGRFSVTALRGGTEPVFAREFEYTGQRLPASAVDSVVGMFLDPRVQSGPRSPITADSIRRRLFRPQVYPPVEAVRVARNGSVWLKVRFFDSPAGVGDWLVLSPRGFEIHRVTLPASFQLLEVNRRTVWGVQGDLLDVPLLVRYTVPDRAV